jgi:filamentous hemagglutinin family protein
MNRIYQLIRNDETGAFVPVTEKTKIAGRRSSSCTTAMGSRACCTLKALLILLVVAFGTNAYALPVGGVVTAGGASISSGAAGTTITQSTSNAAINWQSFNIGLSETVRFVQPNSSSVALNRVLGSDPSSILGSLSANGKVFLMNPNGILFGKGASVNVGGLVASTLNITDSDFMAGTYKFAGAGNGTILNQGKISADGGYVALLGANVSNEGVILAKLGTVALAAGNAITLDVVGDGLLNITVNQGAVNALVQNGGLIRADGGQVLLTAQAAGNLLQCAVNNTGVIQAQTVEKHNGTIKLLGDMHSGTVNVGGTLDASAPKGGDGGFIEASASHVSLADNAIVTTQSAQGTAGNVSVVNSPNPITPSNPTGVSFDPSNNTITNVPGAQTSPIVVPPVTPQVQPDPIITPTVTPLVQPNPIITPTVTPLVQPNPIITPTVTSPAQPNPIITPTVTPLVQPDPVIVAAEMPPVQPEPVKVSVKKPQVQPDPVVDPAVTPPKKLYVPTQRPRKNDRN